MTTGKELGAQPAMPFSRIEEQVSAKYAFSTGVTKRELFAALAMQGALGGTPGQHLEFVNLARESVMHADALLEELAKDGQP